MGAEFSCDRAPHSARIRRVSIKSCVFASLKCAAYADQRRETLGANAQITALAREPEKVARFLRLSGRIETHREELVRKREIRVAAVAAVARGNKTAKGIGAAAGDVLLLSRPPLDFCK